MTALGEIMPHSRTLPAELGPSERQLVAQLRRLKDHGELTTRQLAAKTGYSPKSWERYLGGVTLPPREAVEALARITGTDPVPLCALHEIAAATRTTRRAGSVAQPLPEPRTAPAPPPPAGPPAAPGRIPRIALMAGVTALAVALLATLLLVLRLDGNVTPAAVVAPSPTTGSSPPRSYTCRITRVDGRWSAGINEGRDTEIVYGAAGADVAEAQCLLRRAGITPGGIDGMFGPLTLRAVKTFQQRAGLVVDGMLGPRSWKALREWH
jgi:transcriptional regulator with XRE-family HTH domain